MLCKLHIRICLSSHNFSHLASLAIFLTFHSQLNGHYWDSLPSSVSVIIFSGGSLPSSVSTITHIPHHSHQSNAHVYILLFITIYKRKVNRSYTKNKPKVYWTYTKMEPGFVWPCRSGDRHVTFWSRGDRLFIKEATSFYKIRDDLLLSKRRSSLGQEATPLQ